MASSQITLFQQHLTLWSQACLDPANSKPTLGKKALLILGEMHGEEINLTLKNRIAQFKQFADEEPSKEQNKILSKVARLATRFFDSQDWSGLESGLLGILLPAEITDFTQAKQLIQKAKSGQVNLFCIRDLSLSNPECLEIMNMLLEKDRRAFLGNIEYANLTLDQRRVFFQGFWTENRSNCYNHIECFRLDASYLHEIGKELFETDPTFLAGGENVFQLSKDELRHLAQIIFDKDLEIFVDKVRFFQLNQDELFDYAKRAVDKNVKIFVDKIKNFHPLKQSVDSSSDSTMQEEMTGLENKHFFALANLILESAQKKICDKPDRGYKTTETYSEILARHIDRFQLTTKQRFEICKALLEKDPRSLICNIRHFPLPEDPVSRFQFIKPLVLKNTGQFAHHVECFCLSPKHLLICARIIAKKDPGSFIYNVKKFKLTQPQIDCFVDEIVQKNPKVINSYNIANLDMSPEWRLTFANRLFEEDLYQFLPTIEALDLPNPERYRFAKKTAAKKPERFIEMIRCFELTKEQCYAFACAFLIEKPEELVQSITRFQLTETELLFFAEELIKRVPLTFAGRISKFKLKKNKLLECAKELVKTAPAELAANIRSFDLEKHELLAFAKELLVTSPEALARNISDFKLDGAQKWFYLKELAKRAPDELAPTLLRLDLRPEKFSMLAKIAARKSLSAGMFLQKELQEFKKRYDKHLSEIKDSDDKIPEEVKKSDQEYAECLDKLSQELFLVALLYHPLNLLEQMTSVKIEDSPDIKGLFYFFLPQQIVEQEHVPFNTPILNALALKARELGPQERLILFGWIGYTEICRNKLLNGAALECAVDPLIEQIFQLQAPALRYRITRMLFSLLAKSPQQTYLFSESLQQLFPKNFSSLFRIFVAALTQELSEEEVDDVIFLGDFFGENEVEEVASAAPSENNAFVNLLKALSILNLKDYKDFTFKKTVISSFLTLIEETNLKNRDRIKILRMIFPLHLIEEFHGNKKTLEKKNHALKILSRELTSVMSEDRERKQCINQKVKELHAEITAEYALFKKERKCLITSIHRNLQLMETFCHIGKAHLLLEMTQPEQLEQAMQALFSDITGIESIENFSEKYLRTFANAQEPEAVYIYSGKVKQLPCEERKPVQIALKTFVEGFLTGTLPASRYQEESLEEHLSIVFNGRQELKNGWMQGETYYSNPLRSFGSKVPFEYVDAARGVTTGDFVIESSFLLYAPDNQIEESVEVVEIPEDAISLATLF